MEDHRWFANLLPEGGARESLCRIYGISVSNNAALSGKIGVECAGALRILPEVSDDTDGSEKDGYRDIDFENLKEITACRKTLEVLHQEGPPRLSLAGSQDKWAVKWDGQRLSLPYGRAPSTHILKFPTGRVPGLAENEVFVSRLGAECGLSTVDTMVFNSALLIPRYDRAEEVDGVIRRMHHDQPGKDLLQLIC